VSENVKTKINILRPEDVWQPKRGAQFGNRNAFKTGLHAKEPRALRKQIAQWKRETRALLRLVQETSARRGAV
jgi:hypothetical protein